MNIEVKNLKVQIKQNAWDKISGWCNAAESEVSGLGMVKRDGTTFTVYDAFLPKQECTSSYTELDNDSVADLLGKLVKTGRKPGHLKLWWHTHYNFSCFWSGTDDATAERLAGHNGEWLLSIVTNQKNMYLARLDIFNPVRVTIDGVEIEWIGGHKLRNTDWKYQVSKRVKERTYTQQTSIGFSYPSHYQWDDQAWGKGGHWRSGYRWINGRWQSPDEDKKELTFEPVCPTCTVCDEKKIPYGWAGGERLYYCLNGCNESKKQEESKKVEKQVEIEERKQEIGDPDWVEVDGTLMLRKDYEEIKRNGYVGSDDPVTF